MKAANLVNLGACSPGSKRRRRRRKGMHNTSQPKPTNTCRNIQITHAFIAQKVVFPSIAGKLYGFLLVIGWVLDHKLTPDAGLPSGVYASEF
jgi:hypothetical protein